MPSSSKIGSVPPLPKKVLHQVLPSENPFITDVSNIIDQFNALTSSLPNKYGWRYRTDAGMKAEIEENFKNSTDVFSLNALYWRDQLGNWEAYAYMNTLRVADLLRSCVWSLAREDAVCACLLARSALETAAAFADSARKVTATICGPSSGQQPSPLVDPAVNLRKEYVTSEDLEKYSLKVIFASKLPESEKIYDPCNIMTILSRISKIPGQSFIKDAYGILSETAHPNLLGRELYIQRSEPGPWEGNELKTLAPGNGPAWHFLMPTVVSAMSWACATQVTAFNLMSMTIGTTMSRLNR